MNRNLKFLAGGDVFRVLVQVAICFLLMSSPAIAQELNVIKALDVTSGPEGAAVKIETELPVGYRYTVYDSFDPVRVVVDFPGMDTSALEPVQNFAAAPVQEVRVSSFDLESGKLGRVEILLDKATNYDVELNGKQFQVLFATTAPKAATIAPKASPLGAKLSQPVIAPTEQPAATPVKETPVAVVEPAPVKAAVVESVEAANPEVQAEAKPEVAEPVAAAVAASEPQPVAATSTVIPEVKPAMLPGTILQKPVMAPGSALLRADGAIERHQYFKLGSPPRLVVDLYGVKPGFKERSFSASQGMRRMRVGTYSDKTRLVFDSETEHLPGYQVSKEDDQVKVSWGRGLPAEVAAEPMADEISTAAAPVNVAPPASVEALDFDSKDGRSVFTVKLSKSAKVIPSTRTGDVVRFGVSNVLLSQKLRRSVDASAFPSAVKMITPYTVQSGAIPEVRFAVELKGPVAYSVEKSDSEVRFIVEDGPFAEARIGTVATKEVMVATSAGQGVVKQSDEMVPQSKIDEVLADSASAVAQPAMNTTAQESESVISSSQGGYRIAEEKAGYTGEKISLVFDNADIRKILQLIAEVSDLNIIASDEVKGSITLRLREVPWDQALDLIMDIQDLGMVRDGNIARIMPRERIRELEEAKLTAKRTKEKLEDLVTEVISISYTDLSNIEPPAKDLLSERGKITKDVRNKQIIVTDIPSVISDVRNLVSILDTPERQVMIEARIVEADSSFGRDLGVKWGLTLNNTGGEIDTSLGLGGGFLLTPPAAGAPAGSGLATSMTFGTVGLDDQVLNLRLSALETSGHGKVVSTPRVTTLNGEKAKISQGTQIPYVVTSDSGPNTEFVEATLSLEVTPVINPDGSIILEIKATNSTPGTPVVIGTGGSAPSINSKEAQTKVLVQDGETTVLGGIFVEDEDFSESGVPWLSKVPLIGHLFKSTSNNRTRSELLVFITPRILQ